MTQSYWLPLDGGPGGDPSSPDPMDWPDGPARRLALGHQDERDAPAYCTCGVLTKECAVNPRRWGNPYTF